MAALARIGAGALRKHISSPGIYACPAVRCYWNQDWKPGPYPKTPEERAAAAKKYGLLPEDYEPYPDDGMGLGDYPKLPAISGDARNEQENWDYRAHKMNYGEPVHADYDLHSEDRFDVTRKPRYSHITQLLTFLGAMGISFALFLIGERYKSFKPLMPKQLPQSGVKHYTFEPQD